MKAEFPISNYGPATDRRRAFTLVELLVILGLLALLAATQVSALASAKGRTKVAMCASNVRQLTLASHLYAGDNKDKLPVILMSAWAWDLPWDIGNKLLSYNFQKRTFYCPGTAPRFNDWDNFQNPALYANLWDFDPPNVHVAGYVLVFSASQLVVSNQNTTILAEPMRLSSGGPTLSTPPNAERVLVADATISSAIPTGGTYEQRYTYNYTSVVGGFYKPHTSPHLRGQFPDGGNVGFKDGHVAWRKFDDMRSRTSAGAYFWW
jgi:type II secretory pathway pseudopilin PulG